MSHLLHLRGAFASACHVLEALRELPRHAREGLREVPRHTSELREVREASADSPIERSAESSTYAGHALAGATGVRRLSSHLNINRVSTP